nr:hypothetical protein [Tanacetum cinerariifolium]
TKLLGISEHGEEGLSPGFWKAQLWK